MGFLEKFQSWVGETESPAIYFTWAGISLVAACLQNRVWVSYQIGARFIPLYPNLYVLLLGPSGNGKSLAVNAAMDLMHRAEYQGKVNLYEGKTSAPAMYETMFATARHPERPFIYIVNDELANDIGMGEYADQFIKSLTRMYLGGPFTDSTVTRGTVKINPPYCVNWLACTTREWLGGSVKRDAILGGFFARTVVVEAGYTGKKVPPGSARPPNWDDLDKRLVGEVSRYLGLSGEFHRTGECVKAEREWYMNRPVLDENDPLAPAWRREHPLVLKLALILAVCEGSDDVIEVRHFTHAVSLVEAVSRVIPDLADFVSLSEENLVGRDLLSEIRKQRLISYSKLAKLGWNKGLNSDRLKRLVETWETAGIIRMETVTEAGKPPQVKVKWNK